VNSSIAEQTVAFGMKLPVYVMRDRLTDSLRKPGDSSRYEYKHRLSKGETGCEVILNKTNTSCMIFGIVTRLWAGRCGFDFQHGQEIALFNETPTAMLSETPSLPLNEYRGSFPKGKSSQSVRLATYPHLLVKLSGTTPLLPLYAFMARRGTTLSLALPHILELHISNLGSDTGYAMVFR
jgi:hypothetical protein